MFKKYIKYYKEEFKKSLQDFKSIKTFYKQIPNLLTFIRLVGALPAGLLYFSNPMLSVGLISFLWFTDLIDGRIARKFNLQSKLGADMDTVADKLMFLGSVIPLLSSLPILGISFILETVISGINIFGRVKGLNTRTVFSGKVKTVLMAVTLLAGYLTKLFPISSLMPNILTMLTIGSQLVAIKDYVKEYKRMSEVKKEDERKVIVETTDGETLGEVKTENKSRAFVNERSIYDSYSRVYTGKKKVRMRLKEKKNITLN